MNTVTSIDGTTIAYERTGAGSPVILVGGAFNDRTTVAGLAAALAERHTAIAYDRRGRGDSTDTPGYDVQREVEDIAALVAAAGGAASVFGHSSGAILALEAARRGVRFDRVVVYEPPYVVTDDRPRPGDDLVDRVRALVERDDRDGAAELFLTEGTATPPEIVRRMRESPMWGWFRGLAHTLPYDIAVCGPGSALVPARLAGITAPVLAIGGGASPAWLSAGARAVAAAVPGARHHLLDGQDHGVLHRPESLREPLLPFLA